MFIYVQFCSVEHGIVLAALMFFGYMLVIGLFQV
jgi:hypothetical protein